MILRNYKVVVIAVLLVTTVFSCKTLIPQKAEINRLKSQIESQTAIINRQNELIQQLMAKPTTQIKNEIKIGKKSNVHNLAPTIENKVEHVK